MGYLRHRNCSYVSVDDACEEFEYSSGIMWSIGASRAAATMVGGQVAQKRGEEGGTTGIF